MSEKNKGLSLRKFTRENFIAWLKTQDPRIKFKRSSSCDCPIACFIGGSHPSAERWALGITADYDLLEFERVAIKPPAWALRFMEAVDDVGRAHITPRQALYLVEGKPEKP